MNPTLDRVVARCKSRRVTGVLRVRGDGQEGEIRFLSGIHDDIRCGDREGDAAYEQIASWPSPRFQAVESLPPFGGVSHEAFPPHGDLGEVRPVDLMRYCEERCLTCRLSVSCDGREVCANYELGELKSIEPDSGMTIGVLEATEGTYAFTLPAFELPELAAPRAADPALLGAPEPRASELESPAVRQRAPRAESASSLAPRTFEEPAPLSTDLLEASLKSTRPPLLSPSARHNLGLAMIGLLSVAALTWFVVKATEVSDAGALRAPDSSSVER